MIDVKEAVQVAKAAANDFLGQDTVLQDLMLEEVELNTENKTWAITLSYNTPDANKFERLGAALAGKMHTRKYKTFIIDSETGEFRAMKIREI